jgi:hypothetical protein
MLDRRFKTTIFKHDHVLRVGFTVAPFVLFLLIALAVPAFFMPSILSSSGLKPLDSTIFSSLAIGFTMSLSLLFARRLWRKHLRVVKNIYKLLESLEESKISVDYVEKRGAKGAYMVWGVGLLMAFLTLIFFLFWFVTWMIDYVYLAFVGGWLVIEILVGKWRNRSKLPASTLTKTDDTKKRTVFWETFVLGTTCGIKGVAVFLLMLFSIMSSCGFLVVSLRGYPCLVLSWALFLGWYLLLLTIQITRRLNLKLASLSIDANKIVTTRQIPRENLAIFALSLFFVSAWVTDTHASIVIIQGLIRPSFSLIAFFFASTISVYSALGFARGRSSRKEKSTQKGYLIDKIKLAWLWIIGNLLLGAAFSYAIGVLLLLAGTVILFSFQVDLNSLFAKTVPWKYGAINTFVAFAIGVGLLTAMHIVSYSGDFVQSWAPMIMPLSLIWIILSIWSGLASYMSQRDRLRSLAKKDNRSSAHQ